MSDTMDEMSVHKVIRILDYERETLSVTRVMGGWIYDRKWKDGKNLWHMTSTFVPRGV